MVSFNNCLQLISLWGHLQAKVGEDSFKWVTEEPAEVWSMDCPSCPLVPVPHWLCFNKSESKKPACSAVRAEGTGHCILGYLVTKVMGLLIRCGWGENLAERSILIRGSY